MRTSRPVLVAVCVVLVGTLGLAVPALAQRAPRQPRQPGEEQSGSAPQWLPGINLEPTGTPERTAAPAPPVPARAGGTVAASSASPTAAPTPVPTPAPTEEPTRTDAPVAESSSGIGLVPLMSFLALAVVTGPILLLRRRRKRETGAPLSEWEIDEPEPTTAPTEAPTPDAPMSEWPLAEPEPKPLPTEGSAEETTPDAPLSEWPLTEPEPTPPPTARSAEARTPDVILCDCGRENPDTELFCDYCGQVLTLSKS